MKISLSGHLRAVTHEVVGDMVVFHLDCGELRLEQASDGKLTGELTMNVNNTAHIGNLPLLATITLEGHIGDPRPVPPANVVSIKGKAA